MLISAQLTSELLSEAAMTRGLLERIPADKFGYKPADDLHTIGWNAGHLAEILGWVPIIVGQSEFDLAPVNGPTYVAPVASGVDALLKTFDDNLAQAMATLNGVPDATMDEIWTMKIAGQTAIVMPKGPCLRKWVFSHTAHHRAVLATYLRLAGVKVTSIYEG